MKYKNILVNGFTIFLPLILGGLCTFFFNTNSYKHINKPPLSPPGIVFPIVWSILYLLMGISFYLAKKDAIKDNISILYYVGLAVNLVWPLIFFKAEIYFLSAILIIIMIVLLIILIIRYYHITLKAAYLQIPYLLWLCFALYLNIGIFILN